MPAQLMATSHEKASMRSSVPLLALALAAMLGPEASHACLCGWSVTGELLHSPIDPYPGFVPASPDSLWLAVAFVDSTAWLKQPAICGTDRDGYRYMVRARQLRHLKGRNRGEAYWLSTEMLRCPNGISGVSSCDVYVAVGDTLVIGSHAYRYWNCISLCSSAPVDDGRVQGHPLEELLADYMEASDN